MLILMPLHLGITIYRLAANSHFRATKLNRDGLKCFQVRGAFRLH